MSLSGVFKARAKEWDFGVAKSGNEQVVILFEITQGEHAGKCRTWYGAFSDAAIERTLDSMRHCGWDGDSLAAVENLANNEVEIVIESEEYQGKVNEKVKWVNKPAGLKIQHQLAGSARDAFAARLRGKVIAHKKKYGPQPTPTAAASNGAQSGDPGYSDEDEFR